MSGLTPIHWQTVAEQLTPIIQRALDEDIGDGDITTLSTVSPNSIYGGTLLAKASGIVAGLEVARRTFALVDPHVDFAPALEDGAWVDQGFPIATVTGPGPALLTAERTALNFLQRMSGIATLTRRYVDAVRGTSATILDTRKTAPGLRLVDKWAVALGGGTNHRFGLYDMALIKENHIVAAGGISNAVAQVRRRDNRHRPIEVEVKNMDELREALALQVDRIMLDNMSLDQMRTAVQFTNHAVPLEASGNVSLQTVAAIAATGVDYISVGKLTHSVEALDISFLLQEAVSSR